MWYIKTNTIFGLTKYSCIRINKNILGINSLFFYDNQKLRPQGDPLYRFQIFSRVSNKFFFALYQNKCIVFGPSKYPCIGIDKNILGIDSL